MNIIIIEDERLTAMDLQQTIQLLDPSIDITGTIRSVEEGRKYFLNNHDPVPDLIFSDIRLGDGLSFEILEPLKIPVIFCTAYDEYALTAFKANGIDYILKPFSMESVGNALQKYRDLKGVHTETLLRQYEALAHIFNHRAQRASALLIRYRDRITAVNFEDIALFYMENNIVKAITFGKQNYYPNKSLDDLEKMAGADFFRANRQYLLHRKAVEHASSLLSRKLSISLTVPYQEPILISREKTPAFLKWLSGNLV